MVSLGFWSIGAAALSGVALASVVTLGSSFIWFVLVLAVLVAASTIFISDWRVGMLVALVLFAFGLGVARTQQVTDVSSPELDALVGEAVELSGTIAVEPDRRERSTRLVVAVTDVHAGGGETGLDDGEARVLVVTDAFADVSYGDQVRVAGELSLPESFESDAGRVFDYPGYLAKEGIAYQISFAEVEVLAHGEGNVIKEKLFAIKQWYLRGIGAALPEPHAALAGGITVGDKRSLGDELLDEFRATGIIHIVVLSGYNVTIIAESILRSLKAAPPNVGLGVGSVAIALFAIMTGASASIVRASTMAIIALVARAVGRQYAIARALMVAVVAMVAWSPFVLVFDPGFQLSVLATIGLIYVAPLIEQRLPFVPEAFGLRAIVGATLGTQLFVLPLLLYQMGMLSIVALPVNLLVLISIPFAMLFSFIGGVLGALVPSVAVFAGAPAYVLLSYTFVVVEWFGSLPFAEVIVPAFSFIWVVLAYAGLIGWLVWVYKKNPAPVKD